LLAPERIAHGKSSRSIIRLRFPERVSTQRVWCHWLTSFRATDDETRCGNQGPPRASAGLPCGSSGVIAPFVCLTLASRGLCIVPARSGFLRGNFLPASRHHLPQPGSKMLHFSNART
jgi:hypothetical protein